MKTNDCITIAASVTAMKLSGAAKLLAGEHARINILDDELDRETLQQIAVELEGEYREVLYVGAGQSPYVIQSVDATVGDAHVGAQSTRPARASDAGLKAMNFRTYAAASEAEVAEALAGLATPEHCACGTASTPVHAGDSTVAQ